MAETAFLSLSVPSLVAISPPSLLGFASPCLGKASCKTSVKTPANPTFTLLLPTIFLT